MKFIDKWLRQNKFLLNYSKTTYLLFNTHPYQSVNANFLIYVKRNKIEKSEFVKYLGLHIDNKSTWHAHLDRLSMKLA